MKKSTILSLLGASISVFFVNQANAGAHQSLQQTTCYVFKQGKLTTKAKCPMYVDEGANSAYPTYGFYNYSVNVPKAGVIHVINSTSCQSENSCKTTHTVNKKKAVSQFRYANQGYKVVSEKQAEKLSATVREKLLSCDKTTDGKLEICTGEITGGRSVDVEDTPKWAQ